jgi:NAD(P)-dependent dehydrogenase (short-subunit alcohol dehydrogenase family)
MRFKPESVPGQVQEKQPGREYLLSPQPEYIRENYKGSDKLKGKIAIITGGDSGIGRAVAVHFAREGADVAIVYLEEHKDAEETKSLVEKEGRQCLMFAGDIGEPVFSKKVVNEVVATFGKLNIIVNNAAEQHPEEDFENIDPKQLEKTFRTNIFGYFYLSQEALKHLNPGDSIINCASVTAYRGSKHLIDYASTKGAIVAFTRSLSGNLADKKIRVNAVAPGPIWTPLIPSSFSEEKVEKFGKDVPMGRPGQPSEVAPSFVFLASDDSSYMTGQTLHPNGGSIVNT